jgi:hypothetical protein
MAVKYDPILGKLRESDGMSSGESAQLAKSVYTALLNKTSTNAPTPTLLVNTLGTVTWARTGSGTYTMTCTGAFTVNKTVPVSDVYFDTAGNKMTLERTSADVMTLKTYAAADTETLADVDLTNQYFNVEVYS